MKEKFRKVLGGEANVLFVGREKALLWNVNGGALSRFDLKPDTDTRIAFNDKTGTVCVGGWESGIRCFTPNGYLLWDRKDPTHYSGIVSLGEFFAVNDLEDETYVSLFSSRTGDHVTNIQFARKILPGQRYSALLQPDRRLCLLDETSGERKATEISSFGVLCYAQGTETALVGTASRDMVLLNLSTGRRTFNLGANLRAFNMQSAAYSSSSSCFYTVVTEYEGKPISALVAVKESHPRPLVIKEFASSLSCAFFCAGNMLALSNGQVLETASGEERQRILFET